LTNPTEPRDFGELRGLVAKPLERVDVRTRSSQVTQSAWRLEVSSPSGGGAIFLVEVSPRENHFRGDGLFLGWPQERLAAAYEALRPKSDEPNPEVPQLG
jgi:hypothetical protein